MSFFKSIRNKIEETLNHDNNSNSNNSSGSNNSNINHGGTSFSSINANNRATYRHSIAYTGTSSGSNTNSPPLSPTPSSSKPDLLNKQNSSNTILDYQKQQQQLQQLLQKQPKVDNTSNNSIDNGNSNSSCGKDIQIQEQQFIYIDDVNDDNNNNDDDDDDEYYYDIRVWGNGMKKQESMIRFSQMFNRQKIKVISAGAVHCSIVTRDGMLYTWGDGIFGKLGHGDQESHATPKCVQYFIDNQLKVCSVSSGGKHTLALVSPNNAVYSWGGNDSFQLGLGNISQSQCCVPQRVEFVFAAPNTKVVKLSCSTARSAALTNSGCLYTWGRGDHGRLGHGDCLIQSTPKQVISLYGHFITDLSSGGGHSMALTSKGQVFSWGRGENGQLGHGSILNQQLTPKQIEYFADKSLTIKLVSAGGYHSIAVDTNGVTYGWGRSDYGVLGNGKDEGDKTIPQPINTPQKLSRVSSGFQHNAAISEQGNLYLWGCSAGGRLGVDIHQNQLTPVQSKDTITSSVDKTPVYISCGEIFTIIIDKYKVASPTTPTTTTTTTTSQQQSLNNNNNITININQEQVTIDNSNSNSNDNINENNTPTISTASLANSNRNNNNFIEWISKISKTKKIVSLIQMKPSNLKTNLGLSIEKNSKEFDDTIKRLKSIVFTSNTNNNSEIDELVKKRKTLGNQLLDEYDIDIQYWLDVQQQKQNIIDRINLIQPDLLNSNSSSYSSNQQQQQQYNIIEIQNQCNLICDKLNQSIQLFTQSILNSLDEDPIESSSSSTTATTITKGGDEQQSSLLAIMNDIDNIEKESLIWISRYISMSTNQIEKYNHLVNSHRAKKNEIEFILSKVQEAQSLFKQREKIKSDYRSCKRNNIELSKKIEVLELDNFEEEEEEQQKDMNNNNNNTIDNFKEQLNSLKKEEQRLIKLQREVDDSIKTIIDKYVPEMKQKLAQQDKISSKVKDSGLLIDERKFYHYQVIKTLATHPHNVFLTTFDNQLVVLKEFGIGDQMGKQIFERQVSILTNMNHKCIMPIQAVFYDRNAYIQMEYISGGDLSTWVTNGMTNSNTTRKPWEIQKIFQQIIQGIAYLHSHGVIHRDLKLENILIREDETPVICDFDLSKDISTIQSNATMFVGGTEQYKAPEMRELVAGKVSGTYATDIWAFGVMLYKSHFPRGREPILLPEENQVPIPANVDQRLTSLLSSILQRNPQFRPSAHQIAVHPYFVTSLVEDLLSSRTLIDSREKIAAFRSHVSSLVEISEDMNDNLLLQVHRNNVVYDVFQFFKKVEPSKLFSHLEVSFIGEKGLDHGGLSSEMYSMLFSDNILVNIDQDTSNGNINSELKSIFSRKFNLFERGSSDSPFYLFPSNESMDQDYNNNNNNNPLTNLNITEGMTFKILGKIFLKAVIDGKPIPDAFPSSFFKYLLDIKPNIQDLESFDPQLALSFKKVLMLDNIDEYLCTTFEGLIEDGENIPVNDLNKEDFIKRNIDKVLIGCRQSRLESFKSGFMSIESLNTHFKLFSPTELQLLMCGNTLVDANMLQKNFKFIGFPSDSQTPTYFSKVIEKMSQDELHLFLRFLTGMVVIPLEGLEKPLSIVYIPKSDKLPSAHTCSYQLDLPDYNDHDILQKKLLQMLEWLDSGFAFI